jgi:multiple sugar transport system permease protein
MAMLSSQAGTRGLGNRPKAGFAAKDRARPTRVYGAHRVTVIIAHVMCALLAIYILLPIYWIVVAATKTNTNIVNSFGLTFDAPFQLFQNIKEVFVYQDGMFSQWLLNTVFYAGASGILSTAVAGLAGFTFAKYHFFGRRPIMGFIMGAVAIPATALVIPLYLLFSDLHLVNNPAGMILPSLGNTFGAFLIYVYVRASISDELLDAARIDGASELVIFWRIAVPLMLPCSVTVLLFAVVGTWNNYFFPLLIFSNQRLYPITVGLAQWNFSTSSGYGTHVLYALIVTGGLISMIPTVAAFLFLQRYWRAGLLVGAVRG